MMLIATISGAPTMFQVVDKMTYACYSCLLLADPEDAMFFPESLYLLGPCPSELISFQQA